MMDIYGTNPGPIDDSVLHEQDKHVSSAVWEGQERNALRCHEHTSKIDQWTLTPKQIELIDKAGFGYLRLIPAINLDNPLISALVERWRRETNTFHFTVGEMTVTLEDVGYLLGLPIDGEPVIGVTYTACDAVCMKFLGKTPDSGYTSGGMVKLSWLKETFFQCPEDAPIEAIERHTRAYLLYLVGSTIFSTTTGNKVPVMYLPLFENFDRAGKYAWGAAALSFLYRALGNASLKSQSTISGCLTMLQCWSYYRLNVGRPRLNQDPSHDCFPFVLRWKGKQTGPTANRDVAFYRKALDYLKPSDVKLHTIKSNYAQVEWCPYANINIMAIPEDIRNNLILGRSNTMLICFDKAERHLPDRCLRQFGMLQPIPQDVQRWERKSRGVDGGVDLSAKMESELTEWVDRHLRVVDIDEDVDETDYMPWYLNITRRLIGRPVPISSEFQRMNVALRDIAHVADMISTQGMDDQQIHAVTRIRYLAHDCLRDHAGSVMMEIAEPQNEVVKRVRGKERVRRKGISKRRRKNDLEQSQEADENVHPQVCVVPIGSDHSTLYHMNNEVDHSQLCLPASEGDDAQLCYVNAANEVDESHARAEPPYEEGGTVDANHLSHTTSDNVSPYVEARTVDTNHLSNATTVNVSPYVEVDAVDEKLLSQPSDAAIEVVHQTSLETSEDVAQQNDYSVLV